MARIGMRTAGKADDAHARSPCPMDSVYGILDDESRAGIGTHLFGGEEEDVLGYRSYGWASPRIMARKAVSSSLLDVYRTPPYLLIV